MYKKIDYSNRNVNNNIKRREKNKMIIINKQKNLSAYTNSKNSHFGRILNLRKLKSQNNMTHEKNNSQKLSEKFSTIRKIMPSTGNQLIYNKKYTIPNNNNILSNDYTPSVSTLAYTKKYTSNSINTQNLTEGHNNKYRVNLLSAFSNSNNNILSNDYTPSVSTLAYTKKYTSNSINTQNLTEGHNNKYRVNLLSAFSNSNNNIFIPFFPVQRPVSNFNIGGQLNMENFSKERMTNVNRQFNFTKRNNEKIKVDKNMRQKISTAPSRKRIRKNYSNVFSSMDFYGQKYHHIKIDRSLMDNKLGQNMLLNYVNLGQNKFPKIKNSNQYNEIKKIFNIRNKSNKN